PRATTPPRPKPRGTPRRYHSGQHLKHNRQLSEGAIIGLSENLPGDSHTTARSGIRIVRHPPAIGLEHRARLHWNRSLPLLLHLTTRTPDQDRGSQQDGSLPKPARFD